VEVGNLQLSTWKAWDCFFNGLLFSITAKLSQQYNLIPLIISSIAVIFINARQHAIIEIFIKIV